MQCLRTQFACNWRMRSSVLLLILSFLLPFAEAAVGTSVAPEASLPACCRAHGKHHCATRRTPDSHSGTNGESAQSGQLREKCPYGPYCAASPFAPHLGLPDEPTHSLDDRPATLLNRASASPLVQLETSANQKRGPPVSSNHA